jgi:CRP-like cAMP-binding protein
MPCACAGEGSMSRNPFQNFMVRFGPGEAIFAEGEPGKTMYIVQSGAVQLFREVDGQRQPLGLLEKGDFFGEMSILEGLPRTAGAEAVEPTELIEINNAIFDKMIRGNIEIAIRMLRKLSIRLRAAEDSLAAQRVGGPTTHAPGAHPAPAARPTQRAVNGARLETDDGFVYPLAGEETLVGRYDPVTELRPDIDLTEHDLKRTVSRRHARIVSAQGKHAMVEEVGALNGTSVNEARLAAGEAHPLKDGDVVTIGSVRLRFRG